MMTLFFIVFAAASLVSALLVITRRSPLYAALFLAVTLCAQAGLFTLLGAYFIGIIQVLIYAGAIMILFLFVIMSLDPEEASEVVGSVPVLVGSGLVVVTLVGELLYSLLKSSRMRGAHSAMFEGGGSDHVAVLGRELFTRYLVPFEIGSVLLLVAVLAAVVLAHRQSIRKEPEE